MLSPPNETRAVAAANGATGMRRTTATPTSLLLRGACPSGAARRAARRWAPRVASCCSSFCFMRRNTPAQPAAASFVSPQPHTHTHTTRHAHARGALRGGREYSTKAVGTPANLRALCFSLLVINPPTSNLRTNLYAHVCDALPRSPHTDGPTRPRPRSHCGTPPPAKATCSTLHVTSLALPLAAIRPRSREVRSLWLGRPRSRKRTAQPPAASRTHTRTHQANVLWQIAVLFLRRWKRCGACSSISGLHLQGCTPRYAARGASRAARWGQRETEIVPRCVVRASSVGVPAAPRF